MADADTHVRESSAEMRRRFIPVDEKLLNLFWSVAEVDDETRISSTVEFLELLEKAQETQPESQLSPELEYCIQRLVNGLASTRKASPQGFYLVLVEILRSFTIVEGEYVFKQLVEVYDEAEKKEKKRRLIGLLLGYCALLRSGKGLTDPVLTDATRLLISSISKTRELEVFCITILNELFEKLEEGQFECSVLPALEEELKKGWESVTPWILWTIARVHELFGNVIDKDFLTRHWENPSLLNKSRYTKIGQIMKQSTFAHPNIHPVCEVMNNLALRLKRFARYWSRVIDEIVVPGQKEKTYLAYELTKNILPKLTTAEQVEAVLSPNLVQSLFKNLRSTQSALHSAVVHFVNFLTEHLETMQDSAMQFAIVTLLLKHSQTVAFDRLACTKTISNMTLKLKSEAVILFSEFLIGEIKEPSISSSSMNPSDECICILQMVCSLLNLPAMQTECEWQHKILKFFFLNGFFDTPSVSSHIKKDVIIKENMSDPLRNSFRENFFRGLNFLAPTSHFKISVHKYNDVLYNIIHFAQVLFKDLSGKQAVPLTEEAVKPWKQMYKTMNKLRTSTVKDNENGLIDVFQLLMMQMALQLFTEPSDTIPILEDLFICCSKALGVNEYGAIESNDLPWINVLVDVLVGLLLQNQHLLRAIVTGAFCLLSPHLDVDSMKPVLDVLDPSRTAEGDEPVMEESFNEMSGDDSDEEAPGDDQILDSSDEDVDEAEHKLKVTDELRLALQMALGDNAAESDKDLSEVDEEELNRLDKALTEIFQAHKKKKSPQNAEALMHFRIRCVDVIEKVVIDHPTLPLIVCVAVPLANAAEFALKTKNEMPLYKRIEKVITKITQTKKFHPLVEKKEKKRILRDWEELVRKVENVHHPKLAALLAEYVALSGSALIKDEGENSKLRSAIYSVYKTCLEKFLRQKNCHLHESFFTNFMRKQMSFCEEAAHVLLDSVTSEEPSLFKKTKALVILQSHIINKPEITKRLSEDYWHVFIGRLAEYVVQVLNGIQNKSDVKPQFMIELLNLCKRLTRLRNHSQLNEIPEDVVSRAVNLVPRSVKTPLKNILSRQMSTPKAKKKRKSKEPHSDILKKKSKEDDVT